VNDSPPLASITSAQGNVQQPGAPRAALAGMLGALAVVLGVLRARRRRLARQRH